MSDIKVIKGAVHDQVGPVVTFAAVSDAGRKWINEWTGNKNWAGTIEVEEAYGVASCIEADGLTLSD